MSGSHLNKRFLNRAFVREEALIERQRSIRVKRDIKEQLCKHFTFPRKVLDHRKRIEQEAKRTYAQKQQLLI